MSTPARYGRLSATVQRVSVYFRTRAEALTFAARMTDQEGRRVTVRFGERRPTKVGSGRRRAT